MTALIQKRKSEENLTKSKVSPRNQLNELNGKEWIQETCSVFYQRGLGKNHKDTKYEMQHPAPFSFQDVGRFIRFFTKENELVLDPFCGVASTLKACAILHRKGIGIELSKKWAELGKKRLKEEVSDPTSQTMLIGNSKTTLKNFAEESISYIITSPPYWNILRKERNTKKNRARKNLGLDTTYSSSKDDLGNIIDYNEFLLELTKVFQECYRILKQKKHITVIVSDFRHNSEYVPYHSDVIENLQKVGFTLQGITILVQSSKKLYPYGYPYAYVPNIHHQYALTFKKLA